MCYHNYLLYINRRRVSNFGSAQVARSSEIGHCAILFFLSSYFSSVDLWLFSWYAIKYLHVYILRYRFIDFQSQTKSPVIIDCLGVNSSNVSNFAWFDEGQVEKSFKTALFVDVMFLFFISDVSFVACYFFVLSFFLSRILSPLFYLFLSIFQFALASIILASLTCTVYLFTVTLAKLLILTSLLLLVALLAALRFSSTNSSSATSYYNLCTWRDFYFFALLGCNANCTISAAARDVPEAMGLFCRFVVIFD